MQRRVPLRRIDSITFKLALGLALFTVLLTLVAGVCAHTLMYRVARQEAERDLATVAQELATHMTGKIVDIADCQAYLLENKDKITVSTGFSESAPEELAFDRAFAAAFPGKVFGADVSFNDLTDDLKLLYATWCQEEWILAFETCRRDFNLACVYYVLPQVSHERVIYLVPPRRRSVAQDGNDPHLHICESISAPTYTNRVLVEAWESGMIQTGNCALDDKYGADRTRVYPLSVEGEALGLICVGANLRALSLSAWLKALILMGIFIAVSALVGFLLMRLIHRRYIQKIIRLSDYVESYADDKDAGIADRIDEEKSGHNELTVLYQLLSSVIRELQNPFESIETITDELSSTKEEAERMNHLANTDALTGLGNKAAYDEELGKLQAEIDAHAATFTIVMIDLNYLKRINDQNGHDKGDLALRKVTEQIRTAFTNCPAFRIGGDEFVVILRHTASLHASVLVNGFLKRLEDEPSPDPWTHISAAVGYWSYGQDGAVTIKDIFERADQKMYAHKVSMKAARAD